MHVDRHETFPSGARLRSSELRFAAVSARDRERLLSHYRRLSPEDRRMRFLQIMSDDGLLRHVAGLDLEAGLHVALLDGAGLIVALGEGFCYAANGRQEMELAFSTDPDWRRRGLASRLWFALARRATQRGIERVVLQCDRHNVGMRGLLASVGASTLVDGGEVSATWPVTKASCAATLV